MPNDTLIIRQLPKQLSSEEKEEFLKHFGAISVKLLSNKNKTEKCFAKFESEEKAKNVMLRLHQMNILGSRLSVEYVKNVQCLMAEKDKFICNEDDSMKFYKMFINKLNSWGHSVEFHQPPPPHLKYSYPKANRATINNIAHALASVPKFYTQVLHLMNKMNLPPPFSDIPDFPEIEVQTIQENSSQINVKQTVVVKQSSSESEIESDPEYQSINADIIPSKRPISQKKKNVKRPKFIKPIEPNLNNPPKSTFTHKEVFEQVDIDTSHKKIELKVTSDCIENIQAVQEQEEDLGTFGKIKTNEKIIEFSDEKKIDTSDDKTKHISTEELNANRITEFGNLSVFKNYHPGAPSCRLYIKNLTKNVSSNDLLYIYRRYESLTDSEDSNMFDIRLMQEGRMKGQAFITFQNVELAQKALKETNGFILKGKPMVVVFARSAKQK